MLLILGTRLCITIVLLLDYRTGKTTARYSINRRLTFSRYKGQRQVVTWSRRERLVARGPPLLS